MFVYTVTVMLQNHPHNFLWWIFIIIIISLLWRCWSVIVIFLLLIWSHFLIMIAASRSTVQSGWNSQQTSFVCSSFMSFYTVEVITEMLGPVDVLPPEKYRTRDSWMSCRTCRFIHMKITASMNHETLTKVG